MLKSCCLPIATVVLLVTAGCATRSDLSGDTTASGVPAPTAASQFAAFGTNRIHYVVEGRGDDVLVFVHCWAGNLGFWQEQVPALKDKARLVLIDLPGHGQSDKPRGVYTLDYFAAAVLAVMNHAHVDKATLIGHSMGVQVICRVYAQAPERVRALVAVDGLLRRPPMTAEQAAQFRAPFSTPEYRTHTTNFINTMFPNPGTEALRDRVLSEMLATPQYVMAGSMDAMFDLNHPDWDPKKVNVPVLVINANNPMWTEDYKSYVQSLSPQTDYRMIDGTGHWLMLEKPAEFNTALTAMLQRFGLIAK